MRRPRRLGRDVIIAGVCFVAVIAIGLAGGPRPRPEPLVGPEELAVTCALQLAPDASAVWLDGSWRCGGVTGGLWSLQALDLAPACGGGVVAAADEQGVQCEQR